MKEIELRLQDATSGLQKYAAEIAKTQIEKEQQYKTAIEAQKTDQDLTALMPISGKPQTLKEIEKPLPANKVVLYDPDVFGLEIAARDCRFEMIKIVREVRQSLPHSWVSLLTRHKRLMQSQRTPKLPVIRIAPRSI
jgi:hypothetical protein